MNTLAAIVASLDIRLSRLRDTATSRLAAMKQTTQNLLVEAGGRLGGPALSRGYLVIPAHSACDPRFVACSVILEAFSSGAEPAHRRSRLRGPGARPAGLLVGLGEIW